MFLVMHAIMNRPEMTDAKTRRDGISVRGGRIGVFRRLLSAHQRRTQRRSAQRRAKEIGDSQLNRIEVHCNDVGERLDFECGIYP